MSTSSDECIHGQIVAAVASTERKYKGVRRRKWGKWVSEIRVPGTPERLWLGSYATAEAAAVAHDVAIYCLRGNSSPQNLNFHPLQLPPGVGMRLSPRSVQRAASDAGLATDARLIDSRPAVVLHDYL
ncbi:ethylene-responsive transcription factor ERF020-like protein [Salvia divinorum]|uniref:Ethylene-responsive transcription factor ERF020-like protein n=1 Tax=Salvia divinorum TaxID=28513 RepID=A0ABD1FQ36_SALDI